MSYKDCNCNIDYEHIETCHNYRDHNKPLRFTEFTPKEIRDQNNSNHEVLNRIATALEGIEMNTRKKP